MSSKYLQFLCFFEIYSLFIVLWLGNWIIGVYLGFPLLSEVACSLRLSTFLVAIRRVLLQNVYQLWCNITACLMKIKK